MAERAFHIADAAMADVIHSQAIKVDEQGVLWRFVNSQGRGVCSYGDASPSLIEAVEWLQDRGVVDVIDGADGECLMFKVID